MVDDSDELSSKIFTTFPSFQESHSLLNGSQSKEDLWRTVILLINRKQISEICSHSLLRCSEQDPSEGLFMCVLILTSADPAENEISPEFLRDFIVFMVCIMSTRPPPPPSKQQDKIHLMACQEVRFFLFFFILLYAWVAGFYLCPITRPVYVQCSPAGHSRAQAGETCREQESCSGWLFLTLHPPLPVFTAPRQPWRMRALNMRCVVIHSDIVSDIQLEKSLWQDQVQRSEGEK